ncbi:MAG: TrbC/VirB2 family protein [Candidatus Paceibacterota bacterium]|jgi:type IV secretory pathway VirB2 component (pilin)
MTAKKVNYRFALAFLLVLVFFNFLPLLLLAADAPLVTTVGSDGPGDYTWKELVQLFRNVTDFIFLRLMIPLAVIAIVYAGIRILLGKSKPEDLIKEKGTLRNVAIGIFMALGAYAIVKTIFSLLADDSTSVIRGVMDQVF